MTNPNFANKNKFRFLVHFPETRDFEFFVKGFTFGGLSIGTYQYNTPVRPIILPGDSFSADDVAVDFFVDENWESYKKILAWIKRLKNTKTGKQEIDLTCDISVMILNTKYRDSFNIILRDCFPYSITQMVMDTDDDAAPLISQVMFKINDFDIVDKN